MGRAFSDITFTPNVRAMQERMGSREQYARFDLATNRADRLGSMEAGFIAHLTKPISLPQLHQTIARVLAAPAPVDPVASN